MRKRAEGISMIAATTFIAFYSSPSKTEETPMRIMVRWLKVLEV
jgi:hypothetical protein